MKVEKSKNHDLPSKKIVENADTDNHGKNNQNFFKKTLSFN